MLGGSIVLDARHLHMIKNEIVRACAAVGVYGVVESGESCGEAIGTVLGKQSER